MMSSEWPLLDLFSGIGGFSLGTERAGMTTRAFCEIKPFCRAVLAKHWPDVPCYDDITHLTGKRLIADGVLPRIVTGGFPCQDISVAGGGAGLDGERSRLWWEYHRILVELAEAGEAPEYVVIENSPALRSRGLDRILGALAALRYDAEWHVISAASLGAWHLRERLWIIAYLHGWRASNWHVEPIWAGTATQQSTGCGGVPFASDADGDLRHQRRLDHGGQGARRWNADRSAIGEDVSDAHCPRLEIKLDGSSGEFSSLIGAYEWAAEPDVVRVVHGVPSRVDRITALGNSLVPPIAEAIGRAIVAASLTIEDVV